MIRRRLGMTRRHVLVASGGLFALASVGRVEAADVSAAERANIQIVNDFVAAWPGHDLARIMAFFDDAGVYRMTETTDPARGREAVTARIKTIIDRVERFEVLDTFARGPMVINERIDHFSSGALKAWHGVGVFFLKDRKIVEWSDYTISMDRG